MGRSLLFLRPRRFGRSLWLRTLQAYYDVRLKDELDALFGALAIGRVGLRAFAVVALGFERLVAREVDL